LVDLIVKIFIKAHQLSSECFNFRFCIFSIL